MTGRAQGSRRDKYESIFKSENKGFTAGANGPNGLTVHFFPKSEYIEASLP
jgi:hypothetical protein